MKRSTGYLYAAGAVLSVPAIWYASAAVFQGAATSKQQADCILLSESASASIDSIDQYYDVDGREYAEFNAQNASAIEAQLLVYRNENLLDLRQTWHAVDLYYWLREDLKYIDVVCPEAEFERLRKNVSELAERHQELSITTSIFSNDWTLQ